MTDWDRLIEAVEAGTATVSDVLESGIPFANEHNAFEAYLGSLDAAKALHEALLPGWEWCASPGESYVFQDEQHASHAFMGYDADPARAWLLAILKAYRSTQP